MRNRAGGAKSKTTMGIQDRGYYHEGADRMAARERAPVIVSIIGLTAVFFVLQNVVPGLTEALALHAGDAFRPWQLFTHMLLHGGVLHLVFNMIFLWWLGRDVERLYGTVDTLFLYLLSGLIAGVAFLVLSTGSSAIGASGAVMGVVVLCALYYPTRPMLLWFLVPVPLWLMVVLYIGMDVSGLVRAQGGQASGIAHAAHLGGAGTGLLFRVLDLRLTRLIPGGRARAAAAATSREASRAKRRGESARLEQAPRNLPPIEKVRAEELDDEALAEGMNRIRMDELLEKVQRAGRDSLTAEEAEFLDTMSRRLGGAGGDGPSAGGVSP